MPKRTYIDTCVLIAAFKCDSASSWKALRILDDPERMLVVSDAVRLESLPKAHYQNNAEEVAFYKEVFVVAENLPWNYGVLAKAYELAERYGIAAMDAIHVAHAVVANVDEFVTNEKPTKPMFRIHEIPVRSLRAK